MKLITHLRPAIAGALSLFLIAGCSSASDVRSGSGPSTTAAETTTTVRPSDEAAETTTTAASAAGPSDPKSLLIQGSVSIPAGEAGQLSVVFVGQPYGEFGSSVPVIVRNNTAEAVTNLEITGTARAADGALAGSGSSQGFEPAVLEPGEWGFGYIYFDTTLPAGAKVEATARGDHESDSELFGDVILVPQEVNAVAGEFGSRSYVGIVASPGDVEATTGSVSVEIACFDEASNLIEVFSGYADGEVVPGGTASFSVEAYEAPECAATAVGASGYSL